MRLWLFGLAALVLLLVAAILVFITDPVEWKLIAGIALLGGAAHAGAHLTWPPPP